IKIHNSATLKTQPTNNPIYKAHLQNIKAQTNNLKKQPELIKPLQLHTLNSKQFRKLKDFIGKNSH
ncbi:hypothetical protein, partial [Escherichia coli]|uniref:hypothetical protein n=3 Tax=Enterobacteriaceae TaxID=543 RepID=UPI001BD4350C